MGEGRSIFIGGPTASGKSELALALAERIGGEIISVDSVQVYRGMDIGSAKVSLEVRRRIRHHLIDIVSVREEFSAADFINRARSAEAEIHERGRAAVFCGGTGLYFKAFLEGVGTAPPGSAELRAELAERTLEELSRELNAADPAAWETIDRNNRRRVERAVETIRLTGRPLVASRARWTKSDIERPGRSFVVIDRARDELARQIERRVEEMFANGLVEETRRLMNEGLEENRIASQAIGYRQAIELIKGMRALGETLELVKTRTRQFAKRQRTWFRGQFDWKWIELTPWNFEATVDLLARSAVAK